MKLHTLLQSLILGAVLVFGVVGFTPDASAQSIKVEVRSIAASRDGNSFDPKLNDLKKKLKKPAFAGFTSFKQVSVSNISLENKASKNVRLPNGSSMKFTFHGTAGKLYKLGVSIAKKLNTTLRLSKGSTFFQAGLPYKGGILILAIRVR